MKMPATVRFFGVGGMTAQFYSDEVMRELEEFKPQVVVLTIGGNDIRHDTKPKDIVGFIGAIADKLKLAGVKKVFFTEISERGKFIKDPFLTQKSFNKQRRKINSLVAEMGIGTIKLQATYPQHYDSDLVHFNNKGNEKYFYDVAGGDFPHLLVYGPSGAGKKTRIMCILKELYGSGVEKLRIEQHHFTTPSKKKLEISTISSNYHIEVNPSDVGNNDRVVIQELIKTVAQVNQLETSTQRDFKVVLLTEVDRLTKDAQHALRRTMEKYMATCRLILCCNSTSKVIPAIKSRCLGIRVPAPSVDEICHILQTVCKKEGLNLPAELAKKIAEKSNRNLRRALLMCEACRVQQYPFSADQAVSEPDWEVYLRDTAHLIVQQQSPKRLFEIRGRLYELLTHCIPADVIMKGLLQNLITSCDGELKTEVIQTAAYYEHRLQLGQKAIYHLEAFVAKFMAIYKRFLEEGIADIF